MWLQHLLKDFLVWYKMMCLPAWQILLSGCLCYCLCGYKNKYSDERNSRKERFLLDQNGWRIQFTMIEISKSTNPNHCPCLIFPQEGERSEYLSSNSFLHFLKPGTGALEVSLPSSMVDLPTSIFSNQDKHLQADPESNQI